MAKAKVTHAAPAYVPPPPPPAITEVVLTLSAAEAETLRSILRMIGGGGRRQDADAIASALDSVGVPNVRAEDVIRDAKGWSPSIYFKEI